MRRGASSKAQMIELEIRGRFAMEESARKRRVMWLVLLIAGTVAMGMLAVLS